MDWSKAVSTPLKNFYLIVTSIALVLMIGCGSSNNGFVEGNPNGSFGDGTVDNFGSGVSILPPAVVLPDTDPGTGIIYGKVLDAVTGEVIEGVIVSSGGITSTSDVDGAYLLANVPYADRVVVNTDVAGYSEQSKIVVLSESQHAVILDPPLLPVGTEVSFDPTVDQAITTGSASVTIAADSLVYLVDGVETPAVGPVTANLTNVDASSDPNLMPGDYLNDAGNYIESFGAISVAFEDADGNNLDLAAGTTANVSIPVASSASPLNPAAKYSYDRTSGLWSDEGTLDLSGSTYTGEVDHFSTWNADNAYQQVMITGCVDDGLNTLLGGTVVQARGLNYIGQSSAIAQSDGSFTIAAKANSNILLTAFDEGKPSNSIEINAGSGGALDDCLSITPVSISVTLTWGLNPFDLDTHLVGPNYHVFYGDKGSLDAPPFAQLDRDDLVSEGPEVLTINKFESSGRYVYSVHHFSGDGTITTSPARVKLNYNGETFLFAPPPGQAQGDITWNVFEIIVGIDLNVSDIRAIQTWSTTQPN